MPTRERRNWDICVGGGGDPDSPDLCAIHSTPTTGEILGVPISSPAPTIISAACSPSSGIRPQLQENTLRPGLTKETLEEIMGKPLIQA